MNKIFVNEVIKSIIPYIKVCCIFFSIMFLIGIIWEQHNTIQTLKERIKIKPEIVYVTKIDSVFINKLQHDNDSLKVENFILQYKIARIKEYNKLGKNGNNFRYLSGWIDRALNDNLDL